jgi:spermidine/putrescine ABC transporter ATP-binding subunit
MKRLGVSIRGVTKRFGGVEAVSNVSLEVRAGEFVSLLGPSGCGKTTTLRMIAGFEVPDEGDILLGTESIVDVPPYRRDTSMVFQDYALFPHRTVAQNIGFGLRMRRTPRREIDRKVEAMLEVLGLSGMGDRKPNELSGGQRQRVALGRALVVDPAVLLLDEPLGALDLQLRKQMQLELKRIHREFGITFIYVTHDQEEAITMSDRIAVMQGGRVEQFGPVLEIYTRPATPFVAQFIGEANLLPATVVSTEPLTLSLGGSELTMEAAAGANGLRPGDPVVAVIRPENVRVGASASGSENRFEMSVREVMFAGPFARIIGGVGSVELRALSTDPAALAMRGAQIEIGWRRDDVVVLRS